MSVLFGELLIPGWNEELIGLEEVTGEIKLPCHGLSELGQQGELAGIGADIFFAEDETSIAMAKALCAECPMKAQCLAGALSRQEPCGVWGGELFNEGEIIDRKRKAGRPRLVDAA